MNSYAEHAALIKTLGLITTKKIRENSLKTKIDINNENIIRLIDTSKEKQNKKQLEMLESLGICTPFNNSFSNHLLQDINLDNIKKTMNKKFYDANEMKSIACALDSVFHSTYKYKSGFKIKQHINNLVQIGKASVEGVAMKGDFKSIENAFVLKAPRVSAKSPARDRSESLLHELTVGYALNELREYIPNFAYVYGGFKCSGPIVEESTKKVMTWCNQKDSVRWIVYENIKGVDFADYSKTCTFEDWLNIYMQTLYSIHLANFMIDFTHYDLHDENVIVRDTELTKPMYIPYKTSNGVEYIKCKNISTIIDYGFSHVKINDEIFGVWEHMAFGVYPEHGFQLHDAYKLLLMSMRSLYFAGRTEVLKKVSKLIKFFNKDERYMDIIEKQSKSFYHIAYTRETSSLGILDFTKYIRAIYPDLTKEFILSDPGKGSVVSCYENELCSSVAESIGKLVSDKKITDIVSFFDSYTSSLEKDEDEKARLVELFKDNYKSSVEDAILKIKSDMQALQNLSISVESLKSYSLMEIISKKDILTTEINSVIKSFDLYNDLVYYVDIVKFVSKLYKDTETNLIMNANIMTLNKYYELNLYPNLEIIQKNNNYIIDLPLDDIKLSYVNDINKIISIHRSVNSL